MKFKIALFATALAPLLKILQFYAVRVAMPEGLYRNWTLGEVVLIWVGYVVARQRNWSTGLLRWWVALVLFLGGIGLSHSMDGIIEARRAPFVAALDQVEVKLLRIEPLASDRGRKRFAVNFSVLSPGADIWCCTLTMGPEGNRVSGFSLKNRNPDLPNREEIAGRYEAGVTYEFTVIFDTYGGVYDYSKDKVTVGFGHAREPAASRVEIGLDDVPAAFASWPEAR